MEAGEPGIVRGDLVVDKVTQEVVEVTEEDFVFFLYSSQFLFFFYFLKTGDNVC